MKTISTLAIATASLSLFAASLVSAQGAPKLKQACMADLQRMCPNATQGHGMFMQCFKGRMSEVSPDCKSAIDALKAERAARKAAAAEAAQGAPPPPPAEPH
jgi:hypothetical protein